MKLYFSPGACSLAPHIALLQAGLPFEAERVSLRTKLTTGGADYRAINPKGYIPALELKDGTVLTEVPALLQYIADQAPESKLAPAWGSMERYRLIEWLNYLAAEVHKRFSPLFTPGATEQVKEAAWTALAVPLTFLNGKVDAERNLMGQDFTVADAYLYTVLNWAGFSRHSLNDWPALQAWHARAGSLPQVAEAMRREGLA